MEMENSQTGLLLATDAILDNVPHGKKNVLMPTRHLEANEQ